MFHRLKVIEGPTFIYTPLGTYLKEISMNLYPFKDLALKKASICPPSKNLLKYVWTMSEL